MELSAARNINSKQDMETGNNSVKTFLTMYQLNWWEKTCALIVSRKPSGSSKQSAVAQKKAINSE